MSITSANSTFSLAVANLYAAPQTLSGYASDEMFTTDALDIGEVVMGADGVMTAGYVFNPTKQTVTLMPDSPSLIIFENWALAEKTARDKYYANATILLPGMSRKYTLTKGVLTSVRAHPDAKKMLQPVPFVITWESVVGAPA